MVVRVNIRKVKALVWLASTATFVFAGWTFYDIFTLKQQKHYESKSRDYFVNKVLLANVRDQSAPSQKEFYKQERYEKLWTARVDGSRAPPPEVAGAGGIVEPPKPVAPDINSVLEVSLILWSLEPESRFIAVNYKTPGSPGAATPATPAAPGAAPAATAASTGSLGKESRLHLSEGDPLKPPFDVEPCNGKVLRIDMQEVVFQWGEGEVKVTPRLGASGSDEPLKYFKIENTEDVAADITEPPETTTLIQPGHWIMGTKDLAQLKENPQRFLEEQAPVKTVTPAAGGSSSLEIQVDPPPGSLAASLGVKKGMKIISVNGIPMSSLSSAINWAKQNSDLPTYVIVYEDAGKQETATFHVK